MSVNDYDFFIKNFKDKDLYTQLDMLGSDVARYISVNALMTWCQKSIEGEVLTKFCCRSVYKGYIEDWSTLLGDIKGVDTHYYIQHLDDLLINARVSVSWNI